MNTRTNLPNLGLGLAVCIVVSVMSAYIIGYFGLGKQWGTETFNAAAESDAGSIVITMDGPPFLERVYPYDWCATVFEPAAKLETWLTGVNVRAKQGTMVDFDFTIDTGDPHSALTDPDSPPIFESTADFVDLASLGITVDSDGFILCEVCQRRLSAVINRGGYLWTCRSCKSALHCCQWSEVGPNLHDSIDVYREGEAKPALTGVASEIWQDVGKLAEEGNVIAMPSGFSLDD